MMGTPPSTMVELKGPAKAGGESGAGETGSASLTTTSEPADQRRVPSGSSTSSASPDARLSVSTSAHVAPEEVLVAGEVSVDGLERSPVVDASSASKGAACRQHSPLTAAVSRVNAAGTGEKYSAPRRPKGRRRATRPRVGRGVAVRPLRGHPLVEGRAASSGAACGPDGPEAPVVEASATGAGAGSPRPGRSKGRRAVRPRVGPGVALWAFLKALPFRRHLRGDECRIRSGNKNGGCCGRRRTGSSLQKSTIYT